MVHGFNNCFLLCLRKSEECKKRKQRQQPESAETGSPLSAMSFIISCHINSSIKKKKKKRNSSPEAGDGGKIKHMQIAQIVAQITTKDTIKE